MPDCPLAVGCFCNDPGMSSPKPKRPKKVLYGVYAFHESLCFFEEKSIRKFDAEVTAVKACSTYREAMSLAPKLKLTYVPGVPEDEDELEDEGLTPGDPYDWSEAGAVQDGDWPPMPTTFAMHVFDRGDTEAWGAIFGDAVGARLVTTTLNGDYLELAADREPALLAAFDHLGVKHERAQDIVDNLGMS